jgi:hypothetical protein
MLLAAIAAGVVGCNRAAINLIDAMGGFCQGSTHLRPVGDALVSVGTFDTRNPCWASGVLVQKNKRYHIRLTMPAAGWIDGCRDGRDCLADGCTERDGCLRADLHGLREDEAVHGEYGNEPVPWALRLGVPLRRHLWERWFKVIARIGATGAESHPLDPLDPRDGSPATLESEFVAGKEGELFLYVNDGVVLSPSFCLEFYSNNRGTAEVVIERVDGQR